MKLHPWNIRNLCYTPWKFQRLYPKVMEISNDLFLITPVNSFFWLLQFSHFIEKFHVLSHHPPHLYGFFLKLLIHAVILTVIFPVSDEWLIFRCRSFILCQKKIFWRRKQHSTLYCELAPLTFGVTCLRYRGNIGDKKLWVEHTLLLVVICLFTLG